jgi:hypothetical protein
LITVVVRIEGPHAGPRLCGDARDGDGGFAKGGGSESRGQAAGGSIQNDLI